MHRVIVRLKVFCSRFKCLYREGAEILLCVDKVPVKRNVDLFRLSLFVRALDWRKSFPFHPLLVIRREIAVAMREQLQHALACDERPLNKAQRLLPDRFGVELFGVDE